eukprot:357902-Chlamydomonas_euryale.AAC.10
MSRQISPVLKCTLGWKTLVRKRTTGGTSGYCSGTLIASSNVPPSYGVSFGPCCVAYMARCAPTPHGALDLADVMRNQLGPPHACIRRQQAAQLGCMQAGI